MDFKGYVLIIAVFLLYFFVIFVPTILHDRRVARERKGRLAGSTPSPETKPAEPKKK